MKCPVCCNESTTIINAECCLPCYKAAVCRPIVGEYRQTASGLVFKVLAIVNIDTLESKLQAEYCYGAASIPRTTYPLDVVTGAERYEKASAAMWALVAEYESLISQWSKNMAAGLSLEATAVYDACIDAAMKAAATMRANQTVQQQLGYIHHCCKNAVLSYARKQVACKNIEEPLDDIAMEELEYKDTSVEACPKVSATDKLQVLNNSDRKLLLAWVVDGKTQEQLGAELGIVKAAVSKRLKRIRERLLNIA